ncbi:hypothetical protein PMAYCL1PPCAC_09480, partial [Pristionchus mayeri]
QIVLSAILLAIAFTAPIKCQEVVTTEAATTPPPFEGDQSIDDGTVMVKEAPTNNTEPLAEEGNDVTTNNEPLAPSHSVDNLRELMASSGIPERAIEEYIANEYYRPLTNENEGPGLMWYLKYARNTLSPEQTEKAVRHHLSSEGLSDQAVDEYIAGEFHLGIDTAGMELARREWARKWFAEKANDTPSTTVAPIEASTPVAIDRDEIRSSLSKIGYSAEAIEDYFALGLPQHLPSNEYARLINNYWALKWQHTVAETAHARGQEVLNEVSSIFRNGYQATEALKMLSADGPMTIEKLLLLKPAFEALPQYDRDIFRRVMNYVNNKVYSKLGFEFGAEVV